MKNSQKEISLTKSISEKTNKPPDKNIPMKRIVSIDALRGFTMLWIIGGSQFIISINKVWPNAVTDELAKQMTHSGWSGFYFYDLVAPLFLFLVGLLIPFVILRRLEQGISKKELYLHILKRTLVLYFLGLAMYGLFRFDWPEMRWSSILGRIGICYFFASLLVINTKWKVQAYVTAGILLAHWAVLEFVPVPGIGPGVHTPEGSITTWVDQLLIPGRLGIDNLYDRQGVLSTFTSIAITLLGVLAGHWMKTEKSVNQKTIGLVIAGVVLVITGWLWGQILFLSRNIYTSSAVIYSAGWCSLLTALFYWIIDVKGYKRWSFFLVVIGMNAITIWVGQRFIDFRYTSDLIFKGVSQYLGVVQPVFLAFCVVAVKWYFLYFLYKHKIFLKA